uniref:Uncharacterized protein n=1 Tax=Arion vulgaris TaxID=1028688 RepID=A0A0B7AJB2_9EUPU
MSSTSCLTVCLCIEDLDSGICDILINQLATGYLFGLDQNIHLMLQSSDDLVKLEDLRLDVQDCAYPRILEISCHQTFSDMAYSPDIILVVLSNRSFPYMTDTPTQEQFQRLLGLVHYMTQLSEWMSVLQLSTSKIIVAGDLALTAASILSQKLNKLTAMQLMAIDAQQPRSFAKETTGCYCKANRLCETVKQWWSGISTSALTFLGMKYTSGARGTPKNQDSSYFFSTPVSLIEPMKFVTSSDIHIDLDHVVEVKATTDKAFRIVQEMNRTNNKTSSFLCLANL